MDYWLYATIDIVKTKIRLHKSSDLGPFIGQPVKI